MSGRDLRALFAWAAAAWMGLVLVAGLVVFVSCVLIGWFVSRS